MRIPALNRLRVLNGLDCNPCKRGRLPPPLFVQVLRGRHAERGGSAGENTQTLGPTAETVFTRKAERWAKAGWSNFAAIDIHGAGELETVVPPFYPVRRSRRYPRRA